MKFLYYAWKKSFIEIAVFSVLFASFVPSAFSALKKIDINNLVFIGTPGAELSATFIGDVDGDDLDDLVLADPYNSDNGEDAGAVYVFLADSLLAYQNEEVHLSDADKILYGESGDNLGMQVNKAGDEDDDGLADFTIGTSDQDDAVIVYGASLVNQDDNGDENTAYSGNTKTAVVSVSVGVAENVGCALNQSAINSKSAPSQTLGMAGLGAALVSICFLSRKRFFIEAL